MASDFVGVRDAEFASGEAAREMERTLKEIDHLGWVIISNSTVDFIRTVLIGSP